jgi:hypothetical protein
MARTRSTPQLRGPSPPKKLNIFISYASEYAALAKALDDALSKLLGSDVAEIWVDTERLRAGFDFQNQIAELLTKTHILVIIYTGESKDSHSFTGYEVGYFTASLRSDMPEIPRRIVVISTDVAPPALSYLQGISLGITSNILAMDLDAYQTSLDTLIDSHPIAQFFRDLEESANLLRQGSGYARLESDSERRLQCVRELLISTFLVLKTRKDSEVDPDQYIDALVTPEVPQDLADVCSRGECVAFIGSGLSARAGFPTWSHFVEGMLGKAVTSGFMTAATAELQRGALQDGEINAVADNAVSAFGSQREILIEYYRRTSLSDAPLPRCFQLLKDIPFAGILTSNYDDLLDRTFEDTAILRGLTPRDSEKLLELLSVRHPTYLLKL